MPINVKCQMCGKAYAVGDHMAGKLVHCPTAGCGANVRVPGSASEPELAVAAALPPPLPPVARQRFDPDDDDDEEFEKPRERTLRSVKIASDLDGSPHPEQKPVMVRSMVAIMGLLAVAVLGLLVAGGFVLAGKIGNMNFGEGGNSNTASKAQIMTRNEIMQLDSAIGDFKTTFNVDHIPSQIKLCQKYDQYQLNDPLDAYSVDYLLVLWPHMMDTWKAAGINWNGKPGQEPPVILEGDQCLVFFLGGIPSGAGGPAPKCLGFATDPKDFVKLGQIAGRKGPFFEYASKRLVLRNTTAGGQGGFLSYLDPFSTSAASGKPYLYFSNYGQTNGYNRFEATDCKSFSVQPYFEKVGQYLNSKSYQIISAGKDQKFGPGGQWTPATAPTMPAAGRDDVTNINSGKLMGVGN